MVGLKSWRGSTKTNSLTGNATFSAGDKHVTIKMDSFALAKELGSLIEEAHRLGKNEGALAVQKAVEAVLR